MTATPAERCGSSCSGRRSMKSTTNSRIVPTGSVSHWAVHFACCVNRKRSRMTELSSEARAIVEGRHSDPFHYLGRHRENDRQVVRAYLPEASEVRVVDEHGGETTLTRIHHAGLFLGELPSDAE